MSKVNKRMFNEQITRSDAFLDMPAESQCLYFHLGTAADDDGFVDNPKTIMRMLGSSEDVYKILVAKKFVLVFDNGICVIKHWRINNYIRKQIYKETKYGKERAMLYIRENGTYTFNPEGAVRLPEGHFTVKGDINNDYVDNVSTVRRPSIDKNSIDKIRIDITPTQKFTPPKVEEIAEYCKSRGNKVDPERFWNFYESKGWVIGKSKMKNWKAAVHTWEKSTGGTAPQKNVLHSATTSDRITRIQSKLKSTSQ